MVYDLRPYNPFIGCYYFCFKYEFCAWNKLYSLFGSSTFYTPLIPMADWPSRILGPFNIFSSLGGRVNCGGVYCGDITVFKL